MSASAGAVGQLPFALPEEDRELSPYTGWTRAHWEAVADGLLGAAWRYASPGCALLDLPGRPSRSGPRSDGLEGFARTFLLAAFRAAGDPEYAAKDPQGLLERYRLGVAAGTRTPGRDDADSWPLIQDHLVFGQPMVESASVALGLRLTAPWTWERMDDGERDRAESWLRDALRHQPPPNNWYLFPYSVAGFLESVGRGDAETTRAIERGHELLEAWYRGGGWYTDGDGSAFDHYNGWALHLYPLLHARLTGDQQLLERFGPRLAEFLEGFSLLFDGSTGAPIHQGRSLTYRFAAGAAVALGGLTGCTPLAPGATRRILSGAVRYFLDRGSVGPDGLLSLGWHGPHAATLQPYSGPGSPYWASKCFAALLIPPDDPVWTEREAPPAEADRAVVLPAPGWLIQSTAADGLVRLHNHGSHDYRPLAAETHPGDPCYARLAYSTRTGPSSPGNLPDNHIGVEWRGNLSTRARIHPLGHGSDWIASWHRPVLPEGCPVLPAARIESVLVARGELELRVHRLVGIDAGTVVRATGWAVDARPESAPAVSDAGELAIAGDEVTGRLLPLLGWESTDLVRAPEGTAYGLWALLPRLTGSAGGRNLFAALASLSSAPATSTGTLAGRATAEPLPDGLRVTWSEDRTSTVIRFTPEGPQVTREASATP